MISVGFLYLFSNNSFWDGARTSKKLWFKKQRHCETAAQVKIESQCYHQYTNKTFFWPKCQKCKIVLEILSPVNSRILVKINKRRCFLAWIEYLTIVKSWRVRIFEFLSRFYIFYVEKLQILQKRDFKFFRPKISKMRQILNIPAATIFQNLEIR